MSHVICSLSVKLYSQAVGMDSMITYLGIERFLIRDKLSNLFEKSSARIKFCENFENNDFTSQNINFWKNKY